MIPVANEAFPFLSSFEKGFFFFFFSSPYLNWTGIDRGLLLRPRDTLGLRLASARWCHRSGVLELCVVDVSFVLSKEALPIFGGIVGVLARRFLVSR